MIASRYVFLVLAFLIEAGLVAISWMENLNQHVVEFISLYLLVSLFYLLSCFLITRPRGKPSENKFLIRFVWGAGLVFRLTLLPLDPGLSEDLYRYRWQGKLQAAGGNPYTERPGNPRWTHLRDETWPQVNRKDLPSAYGPLLEAFYAGYYCLVRHFEPDPHRQAWLFKIPFVFLELAAAWVLSRLLSIVGRPSPWLLIYLWSPLVLIEYWAQGHNDPLAIVLVLLAVTAAVRENWTWAFASLTLAALSKLWPIVLFPFFLLQRVGSRWIFRWKPFLVAVPTALVVSWPYWSELGHLQEMLEGFVGGWRNNDGLYSLIYYSVNRNFEQATNWTISLIAAFLVILWSIQLPLIRSAQWSIVGLLLFSANCFPWYLGWIIPFLAIHPNAALLLWTASVVLAYHVLIGYEILGIWRYSDFFRLLEYIPFFAVLLGTALARRILTWRPEPFKG